MTDFKQPLMILAELILCFAIVFAIAVFVQWRADISSWTEIGRAFVVFMAGSLFAMLQVRRIK